MKIFSLFRYFQSLLLLPIGPFSWFMAALQIYYLYEVFATNDTGGLSFTFHSLFLVFWSVFTVLITFQVLANLSRNRAMTLCLSTLGLFIYTVVAAYHFGAHDMLNYNVLIENLSIAFSPESFHVMMHSLDSRALTYGGLIFLIFAGLELKYNTVSRAGLQPLTLSRRLTAVFIYLVLFLVPIDALDPFLNFMRTGYFYYRNERALNITVSPNSYPLMTSRDPSTVSSDIASKPHIFIIIVESLNASAIGQTSPAGVAYTPFLNTLRSNSVYVDPFYGNSIQTAKGHFSLFFSTIPILSGKAFVKYPDLRLDSLASVLNDYGYKAEVFAAHHNPHFDNTKSFLVDRGFDRFQTVEPYLKSVDNDHRLKWGVKDSVFFKRFFDYFDAQPNTHRPTLYALMTIANHFPFNSMAPSDRNVYPDPQSINDHYANSIHLVDSGLKTFYQELKKRNLYENSIVIITSDHAFPLGLHGNYHLEAGYHDDSFRIPFFMTYPKNIAPQTITRPFSQMDINPTILDILSITPTQSHFIGTSILDTSDTVHPIFLVQPYAKHFSVIRYPYKYRFFAKTETEYIYHLLDDPLETRSITHKIDATLLQSFRSDLKRMYTSHAHVIHNQIRPPQSY